MNTRMNTIEVLCTLRIEGAVGEVCVSQSDLLVCTVEDNVESLHGSHAKYEIHSLLVATVTDHQIKFIGNTMNGGVKANRRDLRVRIEYEFNLVTKRKRGR